MRLIFLIIFISNLYATNSYSHGKIIISNIKNDIGYIDVSIYTDKESFSGKNPPAERIRKVASKGDVIMPISNLHEGIFSIFVFHDENNDNKFNQGFLWRPLEGFGYSNDYIPKSMPKYSETTIKIKHDIPVSLKVNY